MDKKNQSIQKYINKKYLDVNTLKKQFSSNKPFSHIALDNFFEPKTLAKVRDALTKEQYDLKEADLFTFLQTKDLNNVQNKTLKEFIEFLKSEEFTKYMSELTESKLKSNKISVHATVYTHTHYLLCHDDELDRRKIAVMIYLTDLENKDGGNLRLFEEKQNKKSNAKSKNNTSSNNYTIKSITPKFNRLALFKISKKSLHDVEEVYTDAIRLTLGWWYYDK